MTGLVYQLGWCGHAAMALMHSGPKPDSTDSGTVRVFPQRPHLPQWQMWTVGGRERPAMSWRNSQLNAPFNDRVHGWREK